MTKMTFMDWVERIPLRWHVVLAVYLLVAPVLPEPHLVEKVRWLLEGTLHRPLDIFDLLFHLVPAVLLAMRLYKRWRT
jgi:hypothetical protein